jgi:predicted dithiol-disulfide oxidoreductase (DUF899 family)
VQKGEVSDKYDPTSCNRFQRTVASRWLAVRERLLEHEKEHTRQYDLVNAKRRRLPMAKIDRDYIFDGPNGKQHLKDLFDGRRQLIVYHFMFDPTWDKGCSGCTTWVDALGDLPALNNRDTAFVVVSRASLAKLEAYRAQKGWRIAWFFLVWKRFQLRFSYDA